MILKVGDKVFHKYHGAGKVTGFTPKRVNVLFGRNIISKNVSAHLMKHTNGDRARHPITKS
jgi:hypothetical protein